MILRLFNDPFVLRVKGRPAEPLHNCMGIIRNIATYNIASFDPSAPNPSFQSIIEINLAPTHGLMS